MSMTAREREVRTFIFTFFAQQGRPPAVEETAVHFQTLLPVMKAIYRQLHDHHAFFLEPGTLTIRMANPFSAVETPYRVHINGRSLFANCAWDAFGIPAMLNTDAAIEADCADCGQPLAFNVESGQLSGDDVLAHFVVPARDWYNDLVYT